MPPMPDPEGPGGPVYRTIRELAGDERPREKLLKHGPEVLSDAELIAILLGSGLQGENVLDLARRLLADKGGLAGLLRADGQTLQATRGVGPAKAAQLSAAVELGRRAREVDPNERPLLTTPEAVFAHMGPRFLGKTKEQLYVLSVDTRGRLLGSPSAVGGSVNSVVARAAEVFREAILLEATSIVLVHNHPSGDPKPSPQDVLVTKGLSAAGELLEIAVLDHLVVGQNSFVSMQREGYDAFMKQGKR